MHVKTLVCIPAIYKLAHIVQKSFEMPLNKDVFAEFATKADHKEATSKDMERWFKDAKAFGKNCSSNNMDIAFSKVKTKGKS